MGTEASGESFIGPVSALEGPPVIFDVTVSEIEDEINRYTDKEFPYVTTMALEGTPAPEFELKAKVSGTTFDFNVKSDTIINVESAGIKTCETDLIESVTGGTKPTTYDCKVFNGTFGDTPDGWDSLPATPKFDNVAIGTQPTATSTTYVGLVYKTDVPGFIRINPNAGGVDASTPVKLWSSDDGITGLVRQM